MLCYYVLNSIIVILCEFIDQHNGFIQTALVTTCYTRAKVKI